MAELLLWKRTTGDKNTKKKDKLLNIIAISQDIIGDGSNTINIKVALKMAQVIQGEQVKDDG